MSNRSEIQKTGFLVSWFIIYAPISVIITCGRHNVWFAKETGGGADDVCPAL